MGEEHARALIPMCPKKLGFDAPWLERACCMRILCIAYAYLRSCFSVMFSTGSFGFSRSRTSRSARVSTAEAVTSMVTAPLRSDGAVIVDGQRNADGSSKTSSIAARRCE